MFATIAERRKEIMTKESKFDQKWMENLTAYVDYVKSNYRFPGNQTVYQNHKIGYWIANQISAKKKDCLLEERKRLLDCFMPPWDKTKKEKQQYLDELLKIDWEMHVPSEKHSLFKVAGFEYTHNMRQLHLSGIHTCEDYIVFIAKKNVAKEKLCSMYCKIYPFLTESTALFLCTLFDIHYKDLSDPEKMETFFLQFPYPTKRHAQDKNGMTKLMQVCSYGDIEMVGYLLEHGADPIITDLLGENSMDYAKRVMYSASQFPEKTVVIYKKLRTILIKHATREKGMDISLLIKELQRIEKTHPNATVKMNNLYGMPVMRVVPGKESDEVWLEGREDLDVTVELRARYEEASEMQEDELEFFTDMLNRGFTLSDFRTALKEDTFQYAKAFMEEHGLI